MRPPKLPAPPAAGTDSPRAALAGFIAHLVSGDTSAACRYAAPAIRGNCLGGLGTTHFSTRAWSIGRAEIRGESAIVVALFDNLCIDGKCVSNTNPTLRPLPKAAFAHAFEAAQTSTGFNPQIACIEVHGRWYVQLGTGSSPVPPQ